MFDQFRNHRFYIIMLADALIFVMALVVAYLCRFDFDVVPVYRDQILQLLPIFLSIKLVSYFLLGLYGGMWRYTSLIDLVQLSKASLLSILPITTIVYFVYGFEGFPRSIFLMEGVLSFVMTGGLRVGIRFFYGLSPGSHISKTSGPSTHDKTKRVKKSILIIGAGKAGEITAREILGNPLVNCRVLGFLDDDRTKWGRRLLGSKVHGGIQLLPKILEREKIDEVLIAIPSATGIQMRRIVEICKQCEMRFRTLPEIGDLITGKVSINNFRDIKYEDLLRRAPVKLDIEEISRYLKGKTVLVTGAGGSIGSELCRQMVKFGIKELILLDAGESNLYNIQMEMAQELNFHSYHSVLGKVQNRQLMNAIFAEYRPHLVFHAAAYKHVPMLEKNPWEAIYNNVLGSQVIMELSLKYNVERFVLVSTDKAVRPTNVMGASKRLTELILQSMDGNGTHFMAVRFGNVAGSSGSVLPLFRRQLEHGGPITVTHPEITRYFMTISEAAQLILQAGALRKSGKIFVLDMGDPIKIMSIAEELVKLSGKEPGKDVEIVCTGLREGEKLYEELIYQGEGIVSTNHKKIMVLQSNGTWNGMNNKEEFKKWLDEVLEELYQIATTYDAQAIKRKLCQIIAEYTPQMNSKSVLQAIDNQDHGQVSRPIWNGIFHTPKNLGGLPSKKGLKMVARRGSGLSRLGGKNRRLIPTFVKNRAIFLTED
jgi:FlaA1/EpsC-like NDP-sugar epimerase